ncbi:MAG: hypothetical protein LBF91_00650, partial [Azoarcus sp.]|nr:hypothetical protein [Azoarcus sp.]
METLINPEFAKPDLDRHRGMNCKTSPRHSASPSHVIPREVAESRSRMDSATSRGMTVRGASRPLYAMALHGVGYACNK